MRWAIWLTVVGLLHCFVKYRSWRWRELPRWQSCFYSMGDSELLRVQRTRCYFSHAESNFAVYSKIKRNEETVDSQIMKASWFKRRKISKERVAQEKLDGDADYNENGDATSYISLNKVKLDSESLKLASPFLAKPPNTSSVLNSLPQASKSVGIDLGTTNSAICMIDGKYPKIIPVDGKRIIPSVVTYSSEFGNTSICVGVNAKRQLLLNPRNTFSSVKRLMGKGIKESGSSSKSALNSDYDFLTNMKITKNYVANNNDSLSTTRLSCPALNRNLSPEEVSSEILKKLVKEASLASGSQITRAVITVPAYFSSDQCRATELAGIRAGLEKVKLLCEPEAAALAYGLTQTDPQIILVFDLGGGTFDVSILEVGNGFAEVIATSGDSHLGGDDFDASIARWFIGELSEYLSAGNGGLAGYSSDHIASMLRKDPHTISQIFLASEKAKILLSTNFSATITVTKPLNLNVNFTAVLSRRKFEVITQDLIKKLLRPVREAALMAGINLPGDSGKVGVDILKLPGNVEGIEDDVAMLRRQQLRGKKLAKDKQKARGDSLKELHHLQKHSGQSKLMMFPTGQTLDNVILVGGATRIPAVRRLVKTLTGMDGMNSVNPDEVVCLGAGVMAGVLDGDIRDMIVVNPWQAALVRAMASNTTKTEIV